jgi:hypothetical protein
VTSGAATVTALSGPVRFARFAFPPNRLGYCGPGGTDLAEYTRGHDDPGLRELAAGFEGAYPYLELIAGGAGRSDALAADVVEAYWIGNALLDTVTLHDFGSSIDDRFRLRAGTAWHRLGDTIPDGVPHHSFHVFHVMPWAGLMRDGVVDEPLRIVDRCRISWATVLEAGGRRRPDDPWSNVVVERTPLEWVGSRLLYGAPVVETVTSPVELAVGDVVAVHWDWVCERLDASQLGWLQRVTNRQLADLHAD